MELYVGMGPFHQRVPHAYAHSADIKVKGEADS